MLDNVKKLGVFGRRKATRQLARRRLRGRLDARGVGPAGAGPFQCAVYFSDEPVNLYQIRQWYAPLQELAKVHPVVVLSRLPETTNILLDECPLPVFHGPQITDVETFMDGQDIGLVLYVNQNTRNFQMLRFAAPAHVFMSHGESDKSYMASNQLKAYDRVFVAGEAAVERLDRMLTEFDVTTRAVQIGRPQTDIAYETPALPEDGRTTVLYAPTWEGDRASMRYGSVSSHGERIISSLIADSRYRVVYRPHPRSGAFDPAYGHDSHRLAHLIHEANKAADAPQHLVDLDTPFGWHLARLDVCISDISAVALDWLATGKPLILTRPFDPRVEVERSRLIDSVPALAAQDAGSVPALIESALAAPDPSLAEVVRHYFGDTSPGAATSRFVRACSDLIESRLSARCEAP